MVNKMFDALKKRNSNLGLSDEVLKQVASVAVIGLSDDADEVAIEARASESRISDMLKTLQSQFDKVRTEAAKSTKDNNKGVDEPGAGQNGKLDEILAALKDQKDANKQLQDRLSALEGGRKEEKFNSLVDGIMKELKIPASLSDLCKKGLSADMDEQAVRDALGATKKTLSDSGVKMDDGIPLGNRGAQTEAEREEAKNWVQEHKVD